MLPKIVHQIVGEKKNYVVQRCLASWEALFEEGFEIKIWTDKSIEVFIKKNFPFALESIKRARNHAEASDIFRYLVVFHYGGHYVDWDIQLLNKSSFLDLCASKPNGYLLVDNTDGSLASECFAACAGEDFLFYLAKDIVQLFVNGERDLLNTLNYSGPFRMRDVLQKYQNSRQDITPIKDVFLYDYHEIKTMPERLDIRPMIHYWLHSWLPNKNICTSAVMPVATRHNQITSM
ncbi:glycosyltransferase family 32 protein [Pedobacter sp. Leaf194]|uniref:glycosyltransferase family 32 protein n=1 Tax=Pedobacter sp. Leaf194 TaxID=1736297 RepID=UPI000703431B|nr:glycosyltransferase [Pedobacter sp. Leaf194]KQS36816.1 hypothetical protein ASG14_07200 [Pedobacter sp. Leaf194]